LENFSRAGEFHLAWMMNMKTASPRLAAVVAMLCLLLPPGSAHAGGQAVKSLLEMRRENVVMQEWDLSCGAAALATIFRYQHGEQVTEKEIATALMQREEYIANPDLIKIREGFSLLDLKRDADARGYKGVGYGKLELDDLVAKAPIIVPIRTRGYNHFVVFRGMRGNRVLVADSAWGNHTMLVEDFLAAWIDYPKLGHVGFVVERRDGTRPPNLLEARGEDFVMLR
jgi:predicted double-glycine peptidase